MTAGADLGTVIAEFLRDAASGRARDSGGGQYDREALREMRAALTHVDAELGDVDIGDLDSRRVAAMLEGLGRSGLDSKRIDAVVVALHQLHNYAGSLGLTNGYDPLPDPALPGALPGFSPPPAPPPPPPPPPAARPAAPSPTFEMLGAVRGVVTWTVRLIVFVTAVLVLLLLLEL